MAKRGKETVNLDALIPRQDLEAVEDGLPSIPREIRSLPVTDLARGRIHYELLRKPEFQRETDDWDIDNVVTFIKSFRDGDLIPAIILWRIEGSFTFVIDGAHRLSALIAWINDDYGDGKISNEFYRYEISQRQKDIAKSCRERIEREVGRYSDLAQIGPNATPEQRQVAANLGDSLVVQTVPGNATNAAKSFLAINQRAVEIDPTERYMIEQRDKPNVIAARAIVRSARGHQWWSKFEPTIRDRISERAKAIYAAVYEPESAQPHTSVDLQPAGFAHSANGLRIAVDLVNLTNGVKGTVQGDDEDGRTTERYIDKTYGVVKYVAGKDFASLSLHPAVYFWSATGNHQPAAFLAVVLFVQEMLHRDELFQFTLVRARFEEFLVDYASIEKNILGRHGGWKKSLGPMKRFLRTVFDGLKDGKSKAEIQAEIRGQDLLTEPEEPLAISTSRWRETKASLRRKVSLEMAPRCGICKARLVVADASDDHITRRAAGGTDLEANAQLSHHFCNHGFKNYFDQRGQVLPEIAFP